jgi:tetratricopeptide (TPR) repeat protein
MQTRRLVHLRGGANDIRQPEPPNEDQLWVIDVGAGELRLARGSQELKELVAKLALPKEARIYALAATSRTLGDLPELEETFAPPPEPVPEPAPAEVAAAPVVAAPEGVVEVAPPRRARDDEFKRLDRSYQLDDYYEPPARPRWVLFVGVGSLVLLLGFAGYRLSRPSAVPPTPVAAAPAPAAAPPPVVAAAPEPVAVVAPPPAAAAPQPIVAPAAAPASKPIPAPAVAAPVEPIAEDSVAAVAQPSDSYAALVAAGQQQFEGGRSKKAQALFERALAVTPEGTTALVGLAYVLVDQGKLSQAVGVFERALKQDHLNPKALFGLAESHRQQGNRRAALDEFKRFLSVQPTGGDAEMARRLVGELASGG